MCTADQNKNNKTIILAQHPDLILMKLYALPINAEKRQNKANHIAFIMCIEIDVLNKLKLPYLCHLLTIPGLKGFISLIREC